MGLLLGWGIKLPRTHIPGSYSGGSVDSPTTETRTVAKTNPRDTAGYKVAVKIITTRVQQSYNARGLVNSSMADQAVKAAVSQFDSYLGLD